jgi:hypothetical protein
VAVNKNFVIKNGLEVDQRLILADANTQKVGIGSTGPRFELDVAGGIGATDLYVIGISTALEYFNVGLGGKVLSVIAGAGGIGTSKVGVGTSNPNYLLEVRSPVSTGQTALYVYGDLGVTGDLSVDDINLDQANINRLYVAQNLDIINPATLYVESGITTLGGYLDVNSNADISGTLNVGGATTIGGYLDITNTIAIGGYLDVNSNADISGTLNVGGATTIGGYLDINSSVDISDNLYVSGIATLANISVTGASLSTLSVSGQTILGVTSVSQLNVSGVGTIATLNSTNANLTYISGTNLNYSGIGTISTLLVGTQVNKATISYTNNTARTLTIPSLGGNRTFAFINQDQTFTGNQNFTNINVSGISTLGNLRIFSGIVTASSGIVTFYGDGSGLINTPPGSPAGSVNQVQYNDGVSFAGSPNLTHDGTTTRIASGIITTVSGSNLNYSNSTITNLSGTNLNYTGIGTIANISGTNLNYTGIGTIANISGSNLNYSNSTITNLSGTNLNYTGIGTIGSFISTNGTITNLSGTNVNLSGVVTSTSYVISGGTSDQFLKANGSVDSTDYASTGKAIAMAMVFG